MKLHHYARICLLYVCVAFIAACGGSNSSPTPTPAPTPTPTPSPTPTPTSTPTVCTATVRASTGYSLVFKGCDANNVAQYYDKTECVQDNTTGLIWEGKTTSGLRASDNKYDNLDSTTAIQVPAITYIIPSQGSTTTPARTPTQEEIDAPTNSIGYQRNVNATNLCGASNWRIPTKAELESIRILGATTLIDFEWFVNTDWNGAYATSTPYNGDQLTTSAVQFYDRGIYTAKGGPRFGLQSVAGPFPGVGYYRYQYNSIRLVRTP
jgi:Protein of unknown function (DUF1566)